MISLIMIISLIAIMLFIVMALLTRMTSFTTMISFTMITLTRLDVIRGIKTGDKSWQVSRDRLGGRATLIRKGRSVLERGRTTSDFLTLLES